MINITTIINYNFIFNNKLNIKIKYIDKIKYKIIS